MDAATAQKGVEAALDEGGQDDAGDGVEGFDSVVGDARVDHLPGLRNQVVEGLVEAEPVDRVEHSKSKC